MATDNRIRDRWADKDPGRDGETTEDIKVRQYARDIDTLAREQLRTGKVNLRVGRKNSGETADQVNEDIRIRIEELKAEFDPEDPKLSTFKSQFEQGGSEIRNGHTWAEVVEAMQRGGQFNSVDEFLAASQKLESPKIYFTQDNELVIGDGGQEVPSHTLGMDYFAAAQHCKDNGLDMLTEAEWGKLQAQGRTEIRCITWLKTGEADLGKEPPLAWRADWVNGRRFVYQHDAGRSNPDRGVRRVLRVKLNFGS